MAAHTELGKIKSVKFGLGGYQNCQLVFQFELGGKDWGTIHTIECGWGHVSEEDLQKPGANYEWTHESRVRRLGEGAWKAFKLMQQAKVDSLDKLVGIPVRAFFDSPFGRNIGFEILEDVL